MPTTQAPLQLLTPEGRLIEDDSTAEALAVVAELSDDDLQRMHREMVVARRFDLEAINLQRQGQLALWVPSLGQEGAQIGSAFATRGQDHVFPSYREAVVAYHHGLDPMRLIEYWRGMTLGGWDPREVGNFHLYTLVIGAQTLHAAGFAMGQLFDGLTGTGDPGTDAATIVYFGDGSTSEGDTNEAMIWAASFQAPLVMFLQNNHWAISVPVTTQSRTPLFHRPEGFGIPAVQIDGNDALASYAATRLALDAARAGRGPRFIEALTYRMGAHTSSDDPTKYRTDDDTAPWAARDPLTRFEAFLRARGAGEEFFADVEREALDVAAGIRRGTFELGEPPQSRMFDHVYSEPHPLIATQKQWLADYEASFGGAA
ncbi:thiamine pyrophosphate-dependent dehydrogenase E1 component subunit alpha [Galbitalea sp. SE-J8]|uniref:thiamine pyrophosphate-dependent dehydrogenase E1 component subunit alpha n=1 Tax=Galbitalea sp. SE-J8 TaxID=3054952 RepID=UPI00259CFE57|nr:thiamine pyrophosphate-dependent dehydrogenase E1 component subunit alpha [Galbitalea sp. SE-J8]MDM4762315.1 thiamine pyrophosphate-dependent dehydrogenase E1 component subunit alpha [Galbitalea sp. SE-J8]